MGASQLALVAARPGMGKTGLGLTIAYELAVRQGRSVGVVSLEMSRDELLQRLLAIHTGVNSREIDARIRHGDPILIDALGVIATAPLALEDSAMLNSGSLEQDADIVIFIYREQPSAASGQTAATELHIAKHRNGALGKVPVYLDATTTRFANHERYRTPETY